MTIDSEKQYVIHYDKADHKTLFMIIDSEKQYVFHYDKAGHETVSLIIDIYVNERIVIFNSHKNNQTISDSCKRRLFIGELKNLLLIISPPFSPALTVTMNCLSIIPSSSPQR